MEGTEGKRGAEGGKLPETRVAIYLATPLQLPVSDS